VAGRPKGETEDDEQGCRASVGGVTAEDAAEVFENETLKRPASRRHRGGLVDG
jgi:hypothetical protein